jgi:hypothetical protein
VPVSILFFGWLLHTKARYISPENVFYPSGVNPLWKAFTAWILLTTVLTIAMYYINKWYVRKLYGCHVEKLRAVLDEMKGDD